MKKLTIRRTCENGSKGSYSQGLRWCKIVVMTLETGETIKRGCGNRGLVGFEAGRKCFYCGNYVYHPNLKLETLWFHFKLAREYWRAVDIDGRDFVNGIPVPGRAEPLPHYLLADLVEVQPPRWFPFYLLYEEEEFIRYLEALPDYPRFNRTLKTRG